METDVLFGLVRAAVSVLGFWLVVVIGTWMTVTDRIKSKLGPTGRKVEKGFLVFMSLLITYALPPKFIEDVFKHDVHTVSGVVKTREMFVPPLFFIRQSFAFETGGFFDLDLSGFFLLEERAYRVTYLPRSRQVLTIEEIGKDAREQGLANNK